jgi:hypothetical protein
MRHAAAGAGPLLCLAAWLLWALTNRCWIGEIPGLRTLAHHAVLDLLVLALLALAWVVLMMARLLALRHPATRSRARTQVLVLALAAVLVLALPSRALTMFRVWHADFVQAARTAPGATDRLSGHWKFGTVTVLDLREGGQSVRFDYGTGVAGLLFNPHDEPVHGETSVYCDPSRSDGGFIRRLEPRWFLCYRMHY